MAARDAPPPGSQTAAILAIAIAFAGAADPRHRCSPSIHQRSGITTSRPLIGGLLMLPVRHSLAPAVPVAIEAADCNLPAGATGRARGRDRSVDWSRPRASPRRLTCRVASAAEPPGSGSQRVTYMLEQCCDDAQPGRAGEAGIGPPPAR